MGLGGVAGAGFSVVAQARLETVVEGLFEHLALATREYRVVRGVASRSIAVRR